MGITGVLNLAAAGLASQVRLLPVIAITADALLVAFVFYVFSHGNIG